MLRPPHNPRGRRAPGFLRKQPGSPFHVTYGGKEANECQVVGPMKNLALPEGFKVNDQYVSV